MEPTTIDYQDDGFQIKISIVNPQIRGTNKFVVYTIKGQDKHGTFQIIRRYSDFDQVRNAMLSRWPGCYIPGMPSKKMVGNMDAQFIEDRRLGLQEFLQTLSKIKHLWYSDQAQILIRSTAPQIDKPLVPLLKPSPSDIIARYQQSFKSLSGKQINPMVMGKINDFSSYLRRVVPLLRTFKQVASNLISVRKKYNQQAYTLLQFMLPEYEKNCLKEYIGSEQGLVFYNKTDSVVIEIQGKLKGYGDKNEFDQLLQGFRKQKRQVEAFLQAIKVKEQYENANLKAKQKVKDLQIDKQKIMAGKTSITAMIKSKTKQQSLRQVELQIQKAQKQQAQLTHICDISTVLLGYIQIDKFKKLRQLCYYQQLKRVAKFERQYAKTQNQLWQAIIETQSVRKIEIDL